MTKRRETSIDTGVERLDDASQRYAVSLALRISKYRCCASMTSPTSLVLDPDADIASYRKLVSTINNEGTRGERLDTMLKFLMGDVLNQGEDVYGEESHCVEGVELQWEDRTVYNVCLAARKVPPENRKLALSHRMHVDLSTLEKDEQKFYLDVAEQRYFAGVRNFRKSVLDQLNDDKCRKLIMALPVDEQAKWVKLIEENKIHYTKLEGMIEGRIPLPRKEMAPDFYVKKVLNQVKEEIGGRTQVAGDEVLGIVVDVIWDAITACRARQINMDDDKQWQKPLKETL